MGVTPNENKLAVEGRRVARGVTYSSRLPALLSPGSEPAWVSHLESASGIEKVFVAPLTELVRKLGDGAGFDPFPQHPWKMLVELGIPLCRRSESPSTCILGVCRCSSPLGAAGMTDGDASRASRRLRSASRSGLSLSAKIDPFRLLGTLRR